MARLTVSNQIVDRYEEFKSELHNEWDRAIDDQWFAFLPTADDAQAVSASYAKRGIACEILKVGLCEAESDAAIARQEENFLGFDVAPMNLQDSLLVPQYWSVEVPDGPLQPWVPIWRLERAYVDNHLNANGLLDSFDAARILCEAVTSMQGLVNSTVPGTYLDDEYKVLAVSRMASL